MSKLSVIIVNYNVRHFLEQCLQSILGASADLDIEVIVVDNASMDGSMRMVEHHFPWVQRIENTENVGFAKANNQAIKCCQGDYILLLNPDTLVEADTFKIVVDFMDQHADAGAVGVKMIDGKGRYLPESKRGLPTPSVAFAKIFGLAKLFPKNPRFGRYYMSHISPEQIAPVEVLAGAFMCLRKTVLDRVGLLDETFFMYGEDIDLSYRINQGGYKNYYLPTTRIIHYKGESTKVGSLNYVKVFYQAMAIFAKKHFSGKGGRGFNCIIQIAIVFRAALSMLKRIGLRLFPWVIDFGMLYAGAEIIRRVWSVYYHGSLDYFPQAMQQYGLPIFAMISLLSWIGMKAYAHPIQWRNLGMSVGLSSVLILVLYALAPVHWHFSRAVLLLALTWSVLYIALSRLLMIRCFPRRYATPRRRYGIVGSRASFETLSNALQNKNVEYDACIYIEVEQLYRLQELIGFHRINTLVFCSDDVSIERIIRMLSDLQPLGLEYLIRPSGSDVLIGSKDIRILQ